MGKITDPGLAQAGARLCQQSWQGGNCNNMIMMLTLMLVLMLMLTMNMNNTIMMMTLMLMVFDAHLAALSEA